MLSDAIHAAVVAIVDPAGTLCGAPCQRVLCTGHSLGAALSGLCALDMATGTDSGWLPRSSGNLRVKMSNFGMPRVGNAAFASYFAQRVGVELLQATRVVHRYDIVPHLPLKDMPINERFHHVAREVWDEHETTGYKVCDGSGEDLSCSDSLHPQQWLKADHMLYLGVPQNNCGTWPPPTHPPTPHIGGLP